jgi:hypothetical protein
VVDAEKLNKYLTHERRKKLNVGWFIAEARDIRIYKICAASLATRISILLRLYCIGWNYKIYSNFSLTSTIKSKFNFRNSSENFHQAIILENCSIKQSIEPLDMILKLSSLPHHA